MKATRYPPADQTTQWFGEGNATVAPLAILWHTTETKGGWPGYSDGATAPNLTYNPWEHRWRQHFPLNGTSRALKNGPDGYATNRKYVCQVEISCYCTPKYYQLYGHGIHDLDDQAFDQLNDFAVFMRDEWGIPLELTDLGFVPVSQNSRRFTATTFPPFRGHCGHQHAPYNDHADPGDLDVARIIRRSPAPPPQQPQEDTVAQISNDPPSDAAYLPVEKLYVKPDGTLWAEVEGAIPPPVVVPPPVDPPPVDPPPVDPPPPSSGRTAPNGYVYQMGAGDVWIGLLHMGTTDSDSVRRMQDQLNGISLPAPGNITLDLASGNYGPQTDTVVRTWQAHIGNTPDPVGQSSVGPKQAAVLFSGSPHTLKAGEPAGSTPPPVVTPPPPQQVVGGIDTPFPGANVTTPYGVKGAWAAGFHTGQDYACGVGTPLRATWTGRVVALNGWGAAYGLHVIYEQVINGTVTRTAYCHMSRIDVGVGASTVPGTHLGLSGNTGNTTGPHLHVEQRTAPFGYNNRCQKPVM